MRLGVVLILIGLLFMGAGLPIAEFEQGEEYQHDLRAEQISESEDMTVTEQVNWTDLTATEQKAVLRSYHCDCVVTFITEEPLSPSTSELDFEDDHWTLVNADGVFLFVGMTEPEPVSTPTRINYAGYFVAAIGLLLTGAGALVEARRREP